MNQISSLKILFVILLSRVIKVWDLRKIKSTVSEPTALYNFPYPGKSKRTHGEI